MTSVRKPDETATLSLTDAQVRLLASRGYELVGIRETGGRGFVALAISPHPCAVEACGHDGPSFIEAYGRSIRSAIRNLITTALRP